MPTTDNVELILNGQQADLPENGAIGFTMSFKLEEEGNFENKLSSSATGITLPATKANDQIFNTFHNPRVEDLTPNNDYRRNMEAEIKVNGVTLLKGKGLLQEAGFAETPIDYVMNVWGNNADWAITARMLTLYECLPTDVNRFDVSTVVASWAFDGSTEGSDYVYAPVRYRQPFGDNDDRVNIYHLRPSLFVYWMLVRGFRALGYTLKSDFMDTEYFRRLVMPWTWGNFYDISNDLTKMIGFKAAGYTYDKSYGEPLPPLGADTTDHYHTMIHESGDPIFVDFQNSETSFYECVARTSGAVPGDVTTPGDFDIFSGIHSGLLRVGGLVNTWPVGQMRYNLGYDYPTAGYDNLGCYYFDETTGTARWGYILPTGMEYLSANPVTAQFTLNLLCWVFAGTGAVCNLVLRVTQLGSSPGTTDYPLATLTTLSTPCTQTVAVANLLPGDIVEFKLIWRITAIGTGISVVRVAQALWLNQNPSGTASWVRQRSTLTLDGLKLQLGGMVNFKWYTVFKNYPFLDFLGGLVDTFNLQIQTDNINRQVLIEPTHKATLPDASIVDGYHRSDMVLDWQDKHDLSKRNVMQLFSDHERQIDFTFKQDGGDGGQNLWAARYKGVYLNNLSSARFRDPYAMNNQSGIIAAVPGSARYILPQRFNTGNRQKVNRFFSAVIHVKMDHWAHYNTDIAPGSTQVAAQLIAIIPEGERTGAESTDLIFEPKLAWYHGQDDAAVHGYMYWVGDLASPEPVPLIPVPRMAAVYYGYDGETKPNLNYNDELINGVVVPGLMKTFFLRRLAIMRNGQLLKAMIRLNLNDITNPYHREHIALMNSLFTVVGIDGYQPISDDSCACTLWKVVEPEQKDADACYPSTTSITTDPAELPQDDLKYALSLIASSDLPQVV